MFGASCEACGLSPDAPIVGSDRALGESAVFAFRALCARKCVPHWATVSGFNSVDRVITQKGNAVCVFNLGHGKSAYRLIAAIHFNTQTVFVLRLLTHAEYDKQEWKNEL
jgi:mRNA-degrading endonuclease HigB of HigAB toxin-antitoxin module